MTDDDRTLAELAAEPLDDVDIATLERLRAAYTEADPVPGDLVERVLFSVALDEVFDEVARLTRVPLDDLAVRGADASMQTGTLTFSAEALTAMVTVNRVGSDSLRVDGWLTPPAAYRVRLRVQNGSERATEADAEGRFSFEGLPEGLAQLSFHPVPVAGQEDGRGDGQGGGTVVTPVFQL